MIVMKRNLPAIRSSAVQQTPSKRKRVLVNGENMFGGKWTKKVIVPERYSGKLTPFKKAYIRTLARNGGLAMAIRGEAWTKKFILDTARANIRNKKFYNKRAVQRLLLALIDVHSKGKKFKEYKGWSEDYNHPEIGEIAIPAKGKAIFRERALQNGIIDEKTRAWDLGYLIYSVNLPYCEEKHGFDFMSSGIPFYPINVEKFAEEYAKRTRINDGSAFAEKVRLAIEHLNYRHWDHPGDHV